MNSDDADYADLSQTWTHASSQRAAIFQMNGLGKLMCLRPVTKKQTDPKHAAHAFDPWVLDARSVRRGHSRRGVHPSRPEGSDA